MHTLQKKILPIEQKLLLHGYSHSASLFCIAAPKVDFWGDDGQIENLFFYKNGNRIENYICEENANIKSNTTVTILETDKKKILNTYCEKTKGKGSCFLYQEAGEAIDCEVKVNKFRWNNMWSFGGIRICAVNEPNRIEFRIGFAPNNKIAVIHIFENQEKYEVFDNESDFDCVKVQMDDDNIYCYFSKDGIEWTEYMIENNYIPNNMRKLGFFLWTDDERYKNWFYTNYIQLHASYNLESHFDVKLDYYTGMKTYDRYDMCNPWIRQCFVDSQMLIEDDIVDFIKRSIDCNYYVALMLNERYTPDKWAYQYQDFDHESMVYGYDMDQKMVYLVGFDKNQYFSAYELSFEIFKEAYHKLSRYYEVRLMRFEVQPFVYSLDKELICKMFREYRDGVDSSYRNELNINQPIRCYGMKIYDVLLRNLAKLCDKRIAYIIHEHKQIMVNRVEFFCERGLIDNTDYSKLIELAKKIEELSQTLLLLCIKMQKTERDGLLGKLERKVAELKECDYMFIETIIKALDK